MDPQMFWPSQNFLFFVSFHGNMKNQALGFKKLKTVVHIRGRGKNKILRS